MEDHCLNSEDNKKDHSLNSEDNKNIEYLPHSFVEHNLPRTLKWVFPVGKN